MQKLTRSFAASILAGFLVKRLNLTGRPGTAAGSDEDFKLLVIVHGSTFVPEQLGKAGASPLLFLSGDGVMGGNSTPLGDGRLAKHAGIVHGVVGSVYT